MRSAGLYLCLPYAALAGAPGSGFAHVPVHWLPKLPPARVVGMHGAKVGEPSTSSGEAHGSKCYWCYTGSHLDETNE